MKVLNKAILVLSLFASSQAFAVVNPTGDHGYGKVVNPTGDHGYGKVRQLSIPKFPK